MKLKVLLIMLLLAAAVGYLLGTENGRAQRDVILVKLGRRQPEGEDTGTDEGLSEVSGDPQSSTA